MEAPIRPRGIGLQDPGDRSSGPGSASGLGGSQFHKIEAPIRPRGIGLQDPDEGFIVEGRPGS